MAATFINPPDPSEVIFSSCIPDISARTYESKVAVSLVADPLGQPVTFFSTSLYAFAGVVSLYDVGRLVESYFRAEGISHAMIGVTFDDATAIFPVQFCDSLLPPDFTPDSSFYTAANAAVVHRSSSVSLAHADHGHRRYRVQVVGRDGAGRIASVEREFSRAAGSDYVSFSVDELVSWALAPDLSLAADFAPSTTPGLLGATLAAVDYFAISYDSLQKCFFIVDEPEFLQFRFRNCFNVPEFLDITATVKQSTEVSRSLATCAGTARHYDQSAHRTFEISTGALSLHEAAAVEALVLSHSAEIICPDGPRPILITDHTLEQDNDPASLCSMKFTFRFPASRIVATPTVADLMAPPRSDIFTSEYSAEFA
ncbi:MAG: hypothetical protein HDR44_01015 [Allobaculum sp.]|nr:hypothetical protein [Allobaculum sp.]